MGQGDAGGANTTIGLWPTVLLAVLLVVPFGVRLATGVEPYPAAILPEGGSTLHLANGITTYDATIVLGRNASGELVRVDAIEFVDPMWVHYLRYLARNEFGLNDLGDIEIGIRGTDTTFRIPRHRATADQRDEVRAWLRERLREQGLDDQTIVVQRIERDADLDTGDVVATRVKSEIEIDL
jgi:hypothetical protein